MAPTNFASATSPGLLPGVEFTIEYDIPINITEGENDSVHQLNATGPTTCYYLNNKDQQAALAVALEQTPAWQELAAVVEHPPERMAKEYRC